MVPRGLRLHAATLVPLAAVLAVAVAQPGSASDNFGGSFGDPPAAGAAPAAQPGGSDGFGGSFGEAKPGTPAPAGDDGFGGSFGEATGDSGTDQTGVAQPEPAQPEPARAEAPAGTGDPGGGDDFGAGSFDDSAAAGSFPEPAGQPQDDGQAAPAVTPPADPPPQGTPPATPPAQAQGGVAVDPGIIAFETRDFGVPPTNRLRSSQFHAPTPTSMPGGQLVTTQQLANAMNAGEQFLLIDVLGAQYTLPNAYQAPAMAQPGHFQDRTQQQTVRWLGQISGQNRNVPIVVLCSDPNCWLSYNAGLRALAAGYGQVYWYRGGHQAWTMAGLPTVPSGF